MKKTILLTGGARSGKSTFAIELAIKYGKNITFMATCQALDTEMKKRIALHRRSRPKTWITIEEAMDVPQALRKMPAKSGAVIIDCLTLWVTNLLLAGKNEKTILSLVKAMAGAIKRSTFSIIIVANEVGSGIVPENKLARDFRDIAGKANQIIAQAVDEVFVMIAGIPLQLKGRR